MNYYKNKLLKINNVVQQLKKIIDYIDPMHLEEIIFLLCLGQALLYILHTQYLWKCINFKIAEYRTLVIYRIGGNFRGTNFSQISRENSHSWKYNFYIQTLITHLIREK